MNPLRPAAAPNTVQAVIFDWSGTIIDHGCCAPAVAFVELFGQRGIELSVAEARGAMGSYKKDHIRTLTALPRVRDQWRRAFDREPGEPDVDLMYDEFIPLQMACLERYSRLIAGVAELGAALRGRGIRLGSTTGYFREAAQASWDAAAAQGFTPDALVCATDVPAARPEPWMIYRNLEQLRVFPASTVVKVGDTAIDIEEALNAGAWAVGVSRTGNGVGLTEAELATLDPAARKERIAGAESILRTAGAHYVIESVADLLPVIDAIGARLAAWERP